MKSKLIITTDFGQLKAYTYESHDEGSPRVTLIDEFVIPSAHQHLADQISDNAGRRSAPGPHMGGGAMSDTHNIELETRRRSIRQVAQKIGGLMAAHPDAGCWLAAHKEMLHPLVEALPRALSARIEKQLPRDISNQGPKDVLGHFLAARA